MQSRWCDQTSLVICSSVFKRSSVSFKWEQVVAEDRIAGLWSTRCQVQLTWQQNKLRVLRVYQLFVAFIWQLLYPLFLFLPTSKQTVLCQKPRIHSWLILFCLQPYRVSQLCMYRMCFSHSLLSFKYVFIYDFWNMIFFLSKGEKS